MLRKLLQRVHIWAGVILGVQIFVWMLSGAVMSVFPINVVRGEHQESHQLRRELPAVAYISPGGVVARTDGALSVTLRTFQNRPAYEVETLRGRSLFDAESGKQLSPLPEEIARDVAQKDFAGDGELVEIALLEQAPREYKGRLPVWRADFDDKLSTRLYVSPQTGKIVARRNAVWRVYDFFWMLHIMDYGERENFNNPLLKIASVSAVFFVLSGLWLLFFKEIRTSLGADIRRLFNRRTP